MKKLTITLVVLTLGILTGAHAEETNFTENVEYSIGKPVISDHAGEAKPVEGTKYLLIPVTAKNVTTDEVRIGGFGPNFQIELQGYHYNVDMGAGWMFGNTGYYCGAETLAPLIPKTFKLVFTVPIELCNTDSVKITYPDGRTRGLLISQP